jgi:hypothetical protein
MAMKPHSKQPKADEPKKAPRLQVVKLEGRIAPRIALNHNEMLVREAAKVKAAKPKKKARVRVVKLEPRVAPGIWQNHNETLVRDRA